MSWKATMAACAIAAAAGAASAEITLARAGLAPATAEGRAVVDLREGEVAKTIASELAIDPEKVADLGLVTLPIDLAADVCEITPSEVANAEGASKFCVARTTSQALNQAVLDGMN